METKKKILVADDSKELSGIMRDLLDYKGYETIVAHDGVEAVEAALKEHPDLILLDLRMPKLDGYEVIRRVRKDSWGKTAKILMLTAVDDIGEIPHDVDLDPQDYLFKSMWGIEEVEKKIKRRLEELG